MQAHKSSERHRELYPPAWGLERGERAMVARPLGKTITQRYDAAAESLRIRWAIVYSSFAATDGEPCLR